MINDYIITVGDHMEISKTGYVALIIILIITIGLNALFLDKKQNSGKISSRQLCFSGIALAIAYITSCIKFKIPLWGMSGAITLFSMFFICLIGYWYGVRVGFTTAFAFSLLQFMQDGGSYILSPFQACCDYFFAFTALGVAGFFSVSCCKNNTPNFFTKNGLIKGYILAIFLRGLFHTIGGYMYWLDYMPESFPKNIAIIYPIVYNYCFIIGEGVITLILLQLPPIKNALKYLTKLALSSN